MPPARHPPDVLTRPPARAGLSRVLAGALGGYALLACAVERASPGFCANLLWIDLRPLAPVTSWVLLLAAGIVLVKLALPSVRPAVPVSLARLVVGALLAAAVINVAKYGHLRRSGALAWAPAFPWSLVVAGMLMAILLGLRGDAAARRSRPAWLIAAVGAFALAMPLGQMVFFGRTDYRHPAESIVVFGAGVRADGQVSDALADRMRTACELHRRGYAPLLLVSGGPGPGGVQEAAAMRRFALDHGISAQAIVVDTHGLNTEATAQNAAAMLARRGLSRVLAVSHAYHLPRVKMACQRAGLTTYTVPARESYVLTAMPWYVAREVAAFWAYLLRPLAPGKWCRPRRAPCGGETAPATSLAIR